MRQILTRNTSEFKLHYSLAFAGTLLVHIHYSKESHQFACERVWFCCWHIQGIVTEQPTATENSSESISWQTHICALKMYKCEMQRANRWVTGFQKHRYGPALWHNKLTHTYFLCLCPLSHPVLDSLEKKKICHLNKVCEGQRGWNDRATQNLNGTRVYIQKYTLLLIFFVVLWHHIYKVFHVCTLGWNIVAC